MSGEVFLDFEYNGTTEKFLNLVCCSTTVIHHADGTHEDKDWWLHRSTFSHEMLRYYLSLHQDKTFYAWSVEAEAGSMMSLGLDVLKFNFIDLFLEYRMLQNHNHDLLHGKQLIDGKVKNTFPGGEKGKTSLASACYKMLGIIIDTEHKERMRNHIISATLTFTEEEASDIMKYCRSDVKPLMDLKTAIGKYYP